MTKQILALFLLLSACSAAHAVMLPVQDCLIGNGTTGPYRLSWENISPLMVCVSVNNQNMAVGLDYTVNGDAGTVTFLLPVPASSAMVVQYDCDPSQSTRVTSDGSIPLQLNYAASQQSSLFLQGALQGEGAPELNLGIRTIQSAKDAGLTGQFLYSAVAPQGSDMGNSFAAILHAQADPNKETHFSLDWSDAGSHFINAGAGSVTPGDDHFVVVAKEDISKQVTATVTNTQDDTNGVIQATNVVNVAATPDPHLKILGSVTDAGSNNEVASINAQDGVSKTVTMTESTVQTDQPANHNLTQQIGVNVTPSKVLQVQGSVSAATDQSATVASVSTTYQPVTQIKVDAGYEDRNAASSDTNPQHFLDTTRVALTITPAKNLIVTGKYGQNVDDGSGNPQPIVLRGVGIQSNMGKLSLQSACNWTQSTTTPLLTTEFSVGLGMHLGHTAVSANYDGSVSAAPAQSAQQTQTYTLSLNHSLTNRVSLSVNGSVTQASVPNTCQVTENYSTTANLGIKF